jgi:hypothetical protein
MFMAYTPPSSRVRNPQGKVAELRLELNAGGKKDKNFMNKKIALKKIVANMTMSNNDMVALFPDIIGCMHMQNLEIKKMSVYTLAKAAKLALGCDADCKTVPSGASCSWSTMQGRVRRSQLRPYRFSSG